MSNHSGGQVARIAGRGFGGALLCLAIATALPVRAATVSVSADYILGSAAMVTEPTKTAPPGTDVDIIKFTDDNTNAIGMHLHGDVAGSNFSNRVSGNNTYSVNGLMRYTTTANGAFNFSIIPGEVSAFGSVLFSAVEGQHAWIRFHIYEAGSLINLFDAVAEASVGFGVANVATCAAALGCTIMQSMSGDAVKIALAGGAHSLDLDMALGTGSHNLVYDIAAFSEGLVLNPSNTPCANGGEGGIVFAQIPATSYCSSIARSGDPLLPIPGTVFLLALGLAGLAVSRRRQQH